MIREAAKTKRRATAQRTPDGEYRHVRKRVASLKPSPENLKLYRPIDTEDPDFRRFASSIKQEGLHEALVVTEDNYIVSGHRRHAALLLIGQVVAPCRVLPVRRADIPTDQYVALLRDYNRQRNKSVAEQVREELVDADPEQAARRLRARRNKSVNGYIKEGLTTLSIEGAKKRWNISSQKADHVKYVKKVIFEDRRQYWPLSVRGVHYPLLNYQFYRNIPRKLRYQNDDKSYGATSDLLTRLRLSGVIPWEALTDETRPITVFRAFRDVRQFVRQEVNNLFCGYWRNLLQSQPNYVEVVCEKNTIYHMVETVTKRFQVPTMSGRGFASIDPWHELFQRYTASGKERLILIVLSDFDPEGEMIPHVAGRTLRDDFGVHDPEIIKAGVTRDQIERYDLPPQNFAKETSSNHAWFVDRNGGDSTVYELEALDPADMLGDLEDIITSVLDMDLFNGEAAREDEEAVYLETAQRVAAEALEGLGE